MTTGILISVLAVAFGYGLGRALHPQRGRRGKRGKRGKPAPQGAGRPEPEWDYRTRALNLDELLLGRDYAHVLRSNTGP